MDGRVGEGLNVGVAMIDDWSGGVFFCGGGVMHWLGSGQVLVVVKVRFDEICVTIGAGCFDIFHVIQDDFGFVVVG